MEVYDDEGLFYGCEMMRIEIIFPLEVQRLGASFEWKVLSNGPMHHYAEQERYR